MEPGNTPLVEVGGIFAKLECTNPCGSIKDRIAKYILEESERRGLLKKGMTIIEATSGNTDIAFSYFGARLGYQVIIVMPENMTEERKRIIRELGAELKLCRAGDFAEAAAIRDRLAQEKGYFNPDQFSNPLNEECHYQTTGREILAQMREQGRTVDAFVAGVGTGGTLVGVGRALRQAFFRVHLAAVEPSESAVMSGGSPAPHGIQGIGDGFIPALAGDGQGGLHPLIGEVICIGSEAARRAAIELEERFGYCVGISSGANYLAAQKLRGKYPTVVTVFSDGYARYETQGLKHTAPGRCRFEQQKAPLFSGRAARGQR